MNRLSIQRLSITWLFALAILLVPVTGEAASQVIAWGYSSTIASNRVLTNFDGVVQISGGAAFNVGLQPDGNLVARSIYDTASVAMPREATNCVRVAASPLYYEVPGFSLALKADGTVVSLLTGYHVPVPMGLSNIIAIAPGHLHALALTKAGNVLAWGDGYVSGAIVPPGLTNVIAIAAGEGFSLALRADGTVVVWGGYFPSISRLPSGLTNVIAISAGYYSAAALRSDGTVVAWGEDYYHETAVPKSLSNVVAIAAGWGYQLTLRKDGTVIGWGSNGGHRLDIPAGLTNVTAISAGPYPLALVGDGPPVIISSLPDLNVDYGSTVHLRAEAAGAMPLYFQWKFNGADIPGATEALLELPNITSAQAGAYSVAVSNAFDSATGSTMRLTVVPLFIARQPQSQSAFRGGTATISVAAAGDPPLSYQWHFNGRDVPGATQSALTLTNLRASDSGVYSVTVTNSFNSLLSTQVILSVGPIAAWGSNFKGETAVPLYLTNVAAVTGGDSFSLALTPQGQVIAWGDNSVGQTNVPPEMTNAIAIAAGAYHAIALGADGRIVSWGDNAFGQTNAPPDVTNVVSIAAGVYHSLALRSDGTVAAWGAGKFTSPGDPYNAGQSIVPAGLSNVVAIAAGRFHSLALTADGALIAWGTTNDYGQAIIPPDLGSLGSIACGYRHTLVLGDNGVPLAWGDYHHDQTNVPTDLSNVVSIAANGYHNLALLADGSVVSWGDNAYGQTNIPTGLTNAVAIACGRYHSLALLSDAPPQLRVPTINPNFDANGFSCSLPTTNGRVYRLEYKDSLTDDQWTPLPLIAGSGAMVVLRDTTPVSEARFYRVRQW